MKYNNKPTILVLKKKMKIKIYEMIFLYLFFFSLLNFQVQGEIINKKPENLIFE